MSSDTATTAGTARAEDQGFPGIWTSLGWVALFMLLQLIAFVVAITVAFHLDGSGRRAMALFNDLAFRAPAAIASLIVASAVMLILLWLYLRKHDRAARLGLNIWSRLGVAPTIGLAIALIAGGLLVSFLYSTYIVPSSQSQAEMRKLFEALPDTLPNQIMLFTAVAIIAPTLEELLFRGLLQTAFARKLPIWAAIIASAAVFALVHGQPLAVPQLMALGAVFGLLYHLTGSLRVTIVAHALNNALALALS